MLEILNYVFWKENFHELSLEVFLRVYVGVEKQLCRLIEKFYFIFLIEKMSENGEASSKSHADIKYGEVTENQIDSDVYKVPQEEINCENSEDILTNGVSDIKQHREGENIEFVDDFDVYKGKDNCNLLKAEKQPHSVKNEDGNQDENETRVFQVINYEENRINQFQQEMENRESGIELENGKGGSIVSNGNEETDGKLNDEENRINRFLPEMETGESEEELQNGSESSFKLNGNEENDVNVNGKMIEILDKSTELYPNDDKEELLVNEDPSINYGEKTNIDNKDDEIDKLNSMNINSGVISYHNDVTTSNETNSFQGLYTSTPVSTPVKPRRVHVNKQDYTQQQLPAIVCNDVDLKRLMEVKERLEAEATRTSHGRVELRKRKRVILEDGPPEYLYVPRRVHDGKK